MFWLKRCPRCEGDLYEDEDTYGRYVACLQCGRYINLLTESATRQDWKGLEADQRPLIADLVERMAG